MRCDKEKKEIDFINNIKNDYDRYIRAKIALEDRKELEQTVRKAEINGYYVPKENRVSEYIHNYTDLIGKSLVLENRIDQTLTNIKIETIEPIKTNTVLINNEYTVNLHDNITTDGSFSVYLGSETANKNLKGTIPVQQVTGTIMQIMDDLVTKMEAKDGKEADPRLKTVFTAYKQVLEQAGKDVKLDVNLLKALDKNTGVKGYANIVTDKDAEIIGKIDLIMGNTLYNTHTSILAHEIQHVLIYDILSKDTMLEHKILKLRDLISTEVDWEVFLPNGVDKNTASADSIEYAKQRWNYVFKNPSTTPGVAASEFLATATTHERLMDKLEVIKNTQDMVLINPIAIKPGETSVIKTLWNTLAKIINTIYKAMAWKGQSAMYMVNNLLEVALKAQYYDKKEKDLTRYEKALRMIFNADKKLNQFLAKEKRIQKEYRDNLLSEDGDKLTKAIKALWNIRGLARLKSFIVQNNIFSSITRDMSDKNISKFYQLFRHAKAFSENTIAPLKQATIDILVKEHNLGNMSIEKRKAAKRILIDTDANALGDIDKIEEYLKNPKKIEEELKKFKDKYNDKIWVATENLGKMLVTNRMGIINGYANAAQIGLDLLGKSVGEEVDEIDKAATLIAIKESAEEDKKLALEAIKENKKGLAYILKLLKINSEQLLKVAYGNDPMYLIKGAKQERFDGNKQYYIIEEKEAEELQKSKLFIVNKHQELSRILNKNIYLAIGDDVDVAFTEGLLNKVQLKNEGESLRRLLMRMNNLTENQTQIIIEELAKEPMKNVTEALIPERTGLGIIYDYRIRIPHEYKNLYMGLNNDIILTTAETVANLTHKQEAMIYNKLALEYFDNFYKKYTNSPDYKFVEISENAKGKYKAYWDSLPYYLKKEIKKKMNGKLMIEESLLVDTFGYKDVNIANMPWIKNSKIRQVWAKKLIDGIEDLVKAWKHKIVAKTPKVIFGNMISNMFVALLHMKDKSISRYIKEYITLWQEMNKYHELKRLKMQMDINKNAGEPIDEVKYKNIIARMERSPLAPIMKDGQYSVILEDIDREWFDNKGIIEETADKLLNLIKRKDGKIGLKEVIDFIYLRKNSMPYNSVMKLTTYSDAINKVIIYNELKKQKDMTEREILDYVDQLHVNYAYLDNRWIKFANDIGMLTFTKYFFRVFPAMVKMASKKAVSVFLLEGTQKATGIDLETPLDQFWNPWESLSRKVGTILDPIDIFSEILIPATVVH